MAENAFYFTFFLLSAGTVTMLLEIIETEFPHLEKVGNNSNFVDFL